MVTYLTEIVENEPSECDRPILQNAQWGRPTHYYLYVGTTCTLATIGRDRPGQPRVVRRAKGQIRCPGSMPSYDLWAAIPPARERRAQLYAQVLSPSDYHRV